MDWIADPQIWISLLTLTALEIVLGVDNIIFISILTDRLPEHRQAKARTIGLALALLARLALLGTLAWMMKLTTPLFSILGHEFAGKDLILIAGGVFLLGKSTHEIHHKLEGEEDQTRAKSAATMGSVLTQIVLLDIVFSLDSVITAVGMVREIGVMVAAVVIAIIVMMVSASSISTFVNRHPTVKMLALSFLLMVGLVLVADGLGHHIPKGYIYFAMAFSVAVEMLNLRVSSKARPVELRQPIQ